VEFSPVYSPCHSTESDSESVRDEIQAEGHLDRVALLGLTVNGETEIGDTDSEKRNKEIGDQIGDIENDNTETEIYDDLDLIKDVNKHVVSDDKQDAGELEAAWETNIGTSPGKCICARVDIMQSSLGNDTLEQKCKEEKLKSVWKIPRKRKIPECVVPFVNNILVLLSRVSQMEDPTVHLVTADTITSLILLISLAKQPLSRCARLLSRVFRNPLCFKQLLSLGVPAIIYSQLLQQNEDIEAVMRMFHKRKGKKKRKVSYSKRELQEDSDSDR